MRIAQVAPLYESVPPQSYGGTERVVSYLTEELVELGHEVTLFASADSRTKAELVACCDRSLRLDESCIDQVAHHVLMLERVHARRDDFDIIHYHIDYLHFPLSRGRDTPHVTTLHGRLDIPDLAPLYREFVDMPVISISESQRRPLPGANWVATVPHGLPHDLYSAGDGGEYLAFLGRISPEKRVDRAISIARRAGMPLRIAAKISDSDRDYFKARIEPLLSDPLVEFLGEIDDRSKELLLQGARALLFPIDWPEPFGLVMIEAMACATPVIAWRHGAVPEVVDEGVTGFIIDPCTLAEERALDLAADAVDQARDFDRRACRAAFDARFTARRMALHYVKLYERLAGGRRGAALLESAP
jgi:glycosyltransferase involved in cell wall biosynthesis